MSCFIDKLLRTMRYLQSVNRWNPPTDTCFVVVKQWSDGVYNVLLCLTNEMIIIRRVRSVSAPHSPVCRHCHKQNVETKNHIICQRYNHNISTGYFHLNLPQGVWDLIASILPFFSFHFSPTPLLTFQSTSCLGLAIFPSYTVSEILCTAIGCDKFDKINVSNCA